MVSLGGFSPASAASDGNTDPENFRAELPAIQNTGAYSCDPAACLLVASPGSIEIPEGAESAGWSTTFRHATALNILTLNGVNGPVSKVEITAPEGVSLAGVRIFDLYSGISGEISEGSASITINCSPAIEAEGTATVAFSSWGADIPDGAEISVTVNGSTGTVIPCDGGLSLGEGRVNTLTADFSGGSEVPPTPPAGLTGSWLVGAADNNGDWVLMTSTQVSSYFDGLPTDVRGNALSLGGGNFSGIEGIEECVWTIEEQPGGYSLRAGNGSYLEITGAKKVRASQTAAVLDIVRNSDGTVEISNPSHPEHGTLQYNVSAPRFTTYTSSQAPVSLIPWDREAGAAIIIDKPEATVDAEATSVSFTYSAVGLSSQVSADVSSDPDGIVRSVSLASGRLTVSLNPNQDERIKHAAIILAADGASAEAGITQLARSSGGEGDGGETGDQPGWLELPAYQGTEDYLLTFRAGGKRNYSYYYDTDWYSSMWVAYPLYADVIGSGRSDEWAPNPDIPESEQINVWDGSYGVNVSGTIYSRGHQIANGDRNGNSAMRRQTFYATNSTPQIQDRFNGGIWNNLENAIQGLAEGRDTVYVATGPVFRTVGGSEDIKWIQPSHDSKKAPVPNYYWKAVLKVRRSGGTVTDAMAVGFWFEHRQYSDSYENYTMSVDEIERLTGFDLFSNLPEPVESAAETNTSWTTFKNYK